MNTSAPDHERLQVYRQSIDAVAAAHNAITNIPAGHRSLLDQLKRAAISVPLNIAEGAGEHRWREKARFYRIARRSAGEATAALRTTKQSFTAIIAMLVRLGAAMERQDKGTRTRTRTEASADRDSGVD